MGKCHSIRLDKNIYMGGKKKKTSFGKHLFSCVLRETSRCLDLSPLCTPTKRSNPFALRKTTELQGQEKVTFLALT